MKLDFFKKLVGGSVKENSEFCELNNVLNPGVSNAFVESYRKLYANISCLPIDDRCKIISVTSASTGDGKTSVAVNLAITLAQNLGSSKILLLDAGLESPSLERMLPKVGHSRGLCEFLAGLDKEPNIVSSSVSGLQVLYAGNCSENSTRLISSEKMVDLFRYCEERFDYIIMVTPAFDIGSEALLMKKHVSGYVLVARSKNSDMNSLSAAIASLETIGAKIFGVVLTGESVK